MQHEPSTSTLRERWKATPGPVKLAWLVFALVLACAGSIIAWAVVETVLYLT